jgi:4-hydroxythreonine-4-phosphate dehydrogenase
MSATNDNSRMKIGITHGDFNGIGYEVIMKTLADPRIIELCTPIIYGSPKLASFHRKTLNLPEFNYSPARNGEEAQQRRISLVSISEEISKIELGSPCQEAGKMAYLALEAAVGDLQKGALDAILTAPINKKSMQSEEFNFPGHTEYLQEKLGGKALMLMVSQDLRVGMVTGHIPLKEVASKINKELILDKLRALESSLRVDFGIRKPRIAVLGLNPHAGEEGFLGSEEQEIIIPAIRQAFDEGILAFGPFPADGLFGSGNYSRYDGILAMYHDQGLAPFKALAFEDGVNFTAGLPYVRTSPVHGTAYHIAGKNQADPGSMRQALYLACSIVNNRRQNQELMKNPLKPATIKD